MTLAPLFRVLSLLLLAAAFTLGNSSASGLHSLTVATVGSGTVSRNPDFPQYPNGSVVTLTASPAADWLFSHWSGDLSGSSNPANIEMSGPRSVTAHFVSIPTYDLNTTISGQGTITLDPPGGSYRSNTVVAATATAAQGWAFASWSGDASGNTTPVSIRMDRNKSISALFAERVAITEPPVDVITNSGSTVTFNVTAQGTGPLHYQWSFKNHPITNATTATLTINNAQTINEGTYSVTVSNTVSSATASAALLLSDSGCTGSNVVTEPTEAALRTAVEIGGHVKLCFNGTITLTEAINITKDVSLDATGRQITISGNDASRIFNVQTNVTFALTNLTLTRGRHRGEDAEPGGLPGFGGAIWNQGGSLLLSQCTLTNNSAIGGNGKTSAGTASPGGSAFGGAILNEHGFIRIISSIISSNTALGGLGAGAHFLPAPGGSAWGGAIASTGGSIHISASRISENVCQAGVGASLTVQASGGAVHFNNSSVTITNSAIQANIAAGSAGSSRTSPPTSPTPALGGAIRAMRGQLTISHCNLSGNSALGGDGLSDLGSPGFGGALYSDGLVAITFSTLSSNLAAGGFGRRQGPDGHGGAWFNTGRGSASETLFHSNVAQAGPGGNPIGVWSPNGTALGGAIQNDNILVLTNCTFALNLARSGLPFSSPNPGNAAGGAIYSSTNSTLGAVNVTLASNSVVVMRGSPYTYPGGTSLGANIASSNGVVTLRNTILAYPNDTNSNVHGSINDAGHNISSDSSANFNSGTSFNFTDPKLGPLADNGGPTLTMALLPGSPAIDFGDSNNAPAIDQRGVARPFGAGVDIGAYEYAPIAGPTVSIRVSGSESVQMSFPASAQTSYQIQRSTDLDEWTTIEEIPASETSTVIMREFSRAPSHTFYRIVVD